MIDAKIDGVINCQFELSRRAAIFWVTSIFLFSLILAAPTRYFLGNGPFAQLIYLPKILLILTMPLTLRLSMRGIVNSILFVFVLSFSFIRGIFNLPNAEQSFFELWVLVPLVYGFLVAPYLIDDLARYKNILVILFCIASVGVLLNPFVNYPWVGANIDIAGVSVEISRQWTTFGLERFGGFSQASYSAASQLVIISILLTCLARQSIGKVIMWIVAGVCIVLTTSKGAFAAYILLVLFYASSYLMRRNNLWKLGWSALLFIVLIFVMLLPLTVLFVHYDPHFTSFASKFLLKSFGERLTWMWPDSLGLLSTPFDWLIGRGLGGIGIPLLYFNHGKSSLLGADNLFVYLAVIFGPFLAAIFLLSLYFRGIILLLFNKRGDLIFSILLYIATYGLVMNMLEEAASSLFLGLAIGYIAHSGWFRNGRACQ